EPAGQSGGDGARPGLSRPGQVEPRDGDPGQIGRPGRVDRRALRYGRRRAALRADDNDLVSAGGTAGCGPVGPVGEQLRLTPLLTAALRLLPERRRSRTARTNRPGSRPRAES